MCQKVPIYKSGDQSILSIYRPISIVSVFRKIFEKVLRRVLNSLNKVKISLANLFGLTIITSTIDVFVELVSTARCGNRQTSKQFRDGGFERKFGTVYHMVLLERSTSVA